MNTESDVALDDGAFTRASRTVRGASHAAAWRRLVTRTYQTLTAIHTTT